MMPPEKKIKHHMNITSTMNHSTGAMMSGYPTKESRS